MIILLQKLEPSSPKTSILCTHKVVWVFTKSKKILSATPNQPWQFFDLDQDVLLMEKVKMNLAKLMAKEGLSPEFY